MASPSCSEAPRGRGCSFWARPLFLVTGWEGSVSLWGEGGWCFYAQKPGWELT